ncbi:uncharacterized mitochondrial protein AtMg01250-like [Vicia villosa]|uniref:uncharacterized mitochondrial protein AtMg01250-like n=1 Tax=Vicia villosa TaxID=3911 RepID=UPI00273CEEFF|nr:uncharacterized mitochondrial protein AtMg01250-like [Vicia villosa]
MLIHVLISESHTDFVPGIQLLDGVLVAKELVDYIVKNHKPFNIKWMEVTVFNNHMSVLVNGSPTKEFKVRRGLHKVGPLSSFLFVLVVEGLSGFVKKASELDNFLGIQVEGVCKVDILQYADDTLLVGDRMEISLVSQIGP